MGKSKRTRKLSDVSKSSSDEYDWEPAQNLLPEKNGQAVDDAAFDDLLSRVATRRSVEGAVASNNSSTVTVSELNPYWNNGGTGLPQSDTSEATQKSIFTNSNKSWLRRAYRRAVEESTSSGKTVTSILLQRWDEATVREMEEEFSQNKNRQEYSTKTHFRSQKDTSEPRWKRKAGPTENSRSYLSEKSSLPTTSPETVSASPLETKDQQQSLVSFSTGSKEIVERYVTDSDINTAAAQLLKAELSNQQVKIDKLRANLEKMREAQRRGIKIRLSKALSNKQPDKNPNPTVLLTTTDKFGRDIPLYLGGPTLDNADHRRQLVRSHDSQGIRTGYLPEDHNDSTLEEIVRQERLGSGKSLNYTFITMAGKCLRGAEDEYEDAFVSKSTPNAATSKHRQKTDAISDYKRKTFAVSKCQNCLENIFKHLIMSVGQRVFLSLPEHSSLVDGHCFISPNEHIGAMTRVDDLAADEARDLKGKLCKMAHESLNLSRGSYIFMEVASYPDAYKHHVQLECIPVDGAALEMLPMYFKKALNDLGSEWDQNRRLINLRKPGLGARDSIPENFAYFSVEFGDTGTGLAKVIEDWRSFPLYFGREIIAGFLEKSPDLWRKPKRESQENLRRKIVDFEKLWSPHENGLGGCSPALEDKFNSEAEGPELPPSMMG